MGRKKKEEKKEYLYQSIGSILLVFVGTIGLIVKIQPQASPFKSYLNDFLGYASIFLAIVLVILGIYINPFFKVKFINKRVLAGTFLLFLSNLMFEGFIFNGAVIGEAFFGMFSSFIGSVGSFIVALMLLIISLYLMFNTKLVHFTQSLILYIRNFEYSSFFSVFKKQPNKEDTLELSAEEQEIFNPENVTEPYEQPTNDISNRKNEDFEIVASLSEPVTLIKSVTSSPKVAVSSIGSPNSQEKQNEIIEDELQEIPNKKNSLPFRNNIWEYPPLTILDEAKNVVPNTGNTKERESIIEKTLHSFSIAAKVVSVNIGPAVTQYALKVDDGVKTTRITNLQSDLALALASPNGQVRIEAPIPGKSLIGIEVPNLSQEIVYMKSMLASPEYKKAKEKSKLSICLGKDVGGNNVYYSLNKMPHLLIAGATGSGKSIMIQSILVTLLFANSPDECKLILVDPKRVELVGYNHIPHLITPVITEASEAVNALKWVVGEMERRLQVLSTFGVRNIDGYNEKSGFQAMPYIVVILDELADLMMTSSNEVEKSIVRIAQLSRATGIHLVLATQRPSTDIITGSIKANVPARIAFNVASQVDSRVILDATGAEKLLGKGDMLFMSPESSKPKRIQGSWVSDEEINRLVSFLKASDIEPDYNHDVVSSGSTKNVSGSKPIKGNWNDELFEEAASIVIEEGKGSASFLQRRLSIGYARAARLLDELEEHGVVGTSDGSKPREVLVDSLDDIL